MTTTEPDVTTRRELLAQPLARAAMLDWEKLAYAVILLLAIVSRLWALGERVVSHDESLHTQYAYQHYVGDGYQHTPLMHGPFLFHLTPIFYWLFGDNDFTARLPVALFGIALVMAPYFLRDWIGRVGALFASFVLLISPYFLYYSRYIRHDIYVLAWATIIFIATWYYLRQRKDKYLWWFAAGLALMFSTKEVSFIYVAIFGSFLVLRLANHLRLAPWLRSVGGRLALPAGLLLLSLLLIGGGFAGTRLAKVDTTETPGTATSEQFAADPALDDAAAAPADADGQSVWRWLMIAGSAILVAGIFLGADSMRPHIDQFAEFDLIILYTTLSLPLVTPLLVATAGWDPNNYAYTACPVAGQETVSALNLFVARLTEPGCWQHFFQQPAVHTGLFLLPALIVSVLVGLWWHQTRWITAAIIFHAIFAFLYTSVFTNPTGWLSGTISSLGYWLEQQEVQRGSQPALYYLFVIPFNEFMPLLFSLLAFRAWARLQRLNKILGYWISVGLLGLLAWSLGGWLYNRPIRAAALREGIVAQTPDWPGFVAAGIVLLLGLLYWLFVRRRQIWEEYGLRRGWDGFIDLNALFGFVPGLIWWLVMTAIAYSIAGEKMPWLSVHFVTPMALLTGWYLNTKLGELRREELLSREFLLGIGLTTLALVAFALALGPVLLGSISLGDQSRANLIGLGRFLGSLLVAAGLVYLWWRISRDMDEQQRRRAWLLGGFVLLSLLTIRFSIMASFRHGDYVNEFMVYAHGAPATKSQVMAQIDELSMRLYGDRSLDVAYDNDTSWPMTWYLRNYPNRSYFADAPTRDILQSPAIVAGSLNWDKVEPLLGDQYEKFTYTFLWWPMEDYREISWDAVFGLESGAQPANPAAPRGLDSPAVRHALWDIFFYRDYTKYGEVFEKDLSFSQWPLRRDAALYIRKDVLAKLWDHGLSIEAAELPPDPYAEGELSPAPALVLGEGQGAQPGQMNIPRNVAIAPDGNIFVLDTGNHRVQLFDTTGEFLQTWGSPGTGPGQFNEPWGIAVDEEYVYIADTWNHRVQKLSHDGQFVDAYGQHGQIGADQSGEGQFFGPRDIALLPDGQLLVTDTGNHRLVRLDRDLNFISSVGGPGSQPGQFQEPVSIALAPDGSVYVSDTWNGRIQHLSSGLTPLDSWQVNAWYGESTENKPYLAASPAGLVFATDPESYRVLLFDSAGDYAGRFGIFGQETNSFGIINGIAVDDEGNVYVADAGNHRVAKFAAGEFDAATLTTDP